MSQVRIAYCGSFVSRHEAEVFEEEFVQTFGEDVRLGYLIILEQRIVNLNGKHVVRILAENAQQEMDFSEWNGPVPTKELELE